MTDSVLLQHFVPFLLFSWAFYVNERFYRFYARNCFQRIREKETHFLNVLLLGRKRAFENIANFGCRLVAAVNERKTVRIFLVLQVHQVVVCLFIILNSKFPQININFPKKRNAANFSKKILFKMNF